MSLISRTGTMLFLSLLLKSESAGVEWRVSLVRYNYTGADISSAGDSPVDKCLIPVVRPFPTDAIQTLSWKTTQRMRSRPFLGKPRPVAKKENGSSPVAQAQEVSDPWEAKH
jgi:hypothetical protein